MLERLVKEVAHRFGLELRRHRPFAPRRTQRMAALGIRTVVDVGAGRGQYGSALRAHGYRGQIVSFEPLPQSFAELRSRSASDSAWQVHNVALGATPARRTMNVASNLASSSLLPMLPEHENAVPSVTTVGAAEVSVARLDDFGVGDRAVMLKLDVQGYEDRVLDGAHETLARVVLLECELSLAELYLGQPAFAELITRLDRQGLRIIDLDPFFYDPRDGRVLSIDALFERRDECAPSSA